MAAAALPVAKVVVTQVLPVLYDGYKKRGRIIETAKRCEASMHKAEELLNAPSASSSDPEVGAAVARLSKCVEEMHEYLAQMTQNMPQRAEGGAEDKAKSAGGSGILGGMMNTAKQAIDIGRSTVDALIGKHEARLNELNQALLLASVDLGLAISRIPTPKPKSSVCALQ